MFYKFLYYFWLKSNHTKSLTIFNSLSQFSFQSLLSFIFREYKLIEACMSNRQFFFIISFETNDKFNIFQPCNWSSIWTSCEGQQLFLLLVRKVIQHDFPEPLHELVVRVQWLDVFCYSPEGCEVQVVCATAVLF